MYIPNLHVFIIDMDVNVYAHLFGKLPAIETLATLNVVHTMSTKMLQWLCKDNYKDGASKHQYT